jgi:hypothetical protein
MNPARPSVQSMLISYVFLNLSEVFRYFAFVMPMMRKAMPQIQNVAPMNLGVFTIWGAWMTILWAAMTGFYCLYFERFGHDTRQVVTAATLVWLAIFCLIWIGIWNMNLAPASVALVALPFAWLEMVIAAFIVRWGMGRRVSAV